MVEPNLNAYLQNQIKQGLNGRSFNTLVMDETLALREGASGASIII